MKNRKIKTQVVILLLLFGCACFGCGVLYGQHVLIADGFLYREDTGDTENKTDEVSDSVSADSNAAQKASAVKAPASKEKVSLNCGTVEDLSAIEGIGLRTAEKIIASRHAEGNFSSVDELVSRGILGKNKLAQIKAYLVVD